MIALEIVLVALPIEVPAAAAGMMHGLISTILENSWRRSIQGRRGVTDAIQNLIARPTNGAVLSTWNEALFVTQDA